MNLAWSDLITHDGEPERDRRKAYQCKHANCGFWFRADEPRDYHDAECERIAKRKRIERMSRDGANPAGNHLNLSDSDIATMFRMLYVGRETYLDIATRFNVSKQTVSDICRGRTNRTRTAALRELYGVRNKFDDIA